MGGCSPSSPSSAATSTSPPCSSAPSSTSRRAPAPRSPHPVSSPPWFFRHAATAVSAAAALRPAAPAPAAVADAAATACASAAARRRAPRLTAGLPRIRKHRPDGRPVCPAAASPIPHPRRPLRPRHLFPLRPNTRRGVRQTCSLRTPRLHAPERAKDGRPGPRHPPPRLADGRISRPGACRPDRRERRRERAALAAAALARPRPQAGRRVGARRRGQGELPTTPPPLVSAAHLPSARAPRTFSTCSAACARRTPRAPARRPRRKRRCRRPSSWDDSSFARR